MLMIIGVDVVVIALARFLLGGDGGWLAAQMGHPEWFGLTFYDTISPTFLFISGISFPFSCAKQLAHGRTKAQILLPLPASWVQAKEKVGDGVFLSVFAFRHFFVSQTMLCVTLSFVIICGDKA